MPSSARRAVRRLFGFGQRGAVHIATRRVSMAHIETVSSVAVCCGKGCRRERHHEEDRQKQKCNKRIRRDRRFAAGCGAYLENPHVFLSIAHVSHARRGWTGIAANAAHNRGSPRLYRDLIMARIPRDAPANALAEGRTALHCDSSAAHLGRERHAMP